MFVSGKFDLRILPASETKPDSAGQKRLDSRNCEPSEQTETHPLQKNQAVKNDSANTFRQAARHRLMPLGNQNELDEQLEFDANTQENQYSRPVTA
ncbi:MAG: hypothetical protein IPK58_23995 [Acidobacteria bacterium]|nr:hypothetical protein [Acidobacteriota bacterium]